MHSATLIMSSVLAPALPTGTALAPSVLPLAQGGNPFTGLTTTLTAWLQQLIVPGAIIGLLAAVLFFLIGPMFPDLSSSSKGYIQKALLAIVFAGVIPTLVTALAGTAGTGG